MSDRRTPVGITINSLLTRAVPGSIFLFIVAINFSMILLFNNISSDLIIDYQSYVLNINTVIFFLVISIIIGEVIDYTRENFEPVPKEFRLVVYRESQNEAVLSMLQRRKVMKKNDRTRGGLKQNLPKIIQDCVFPTITTVLDLFHATIRYLTPKWMFTDEQTEGYFSEYTDEKFIKTLKKDNDISDNFDDPNQLYFILLNQISGSENDKTMRSRQMYEALRNTIYSTIMGSLLTLFVIMLLILQGDRVEAAIITLIVFIFVYTMLYFIVIYSDIVQIEKRYVNLLMTEYLIK